MDVYGEGCGVRNSICVYPCYFVVEEFRESSLNVELVFEICGGIHDNLHIYHFIY